MTYSVHSPDRFSHSRFTRRDFLAAVTVAPLVTRVGHADRRGNQGRAGANRSDQQSCRRHSGADQVRLIQSLRPILPPDASYTSRAGDPYVVSIGPIALATQPRPGWEWTVDNVTSNGLDVVFTWSTGEQPTFTGAILHIFLNGYLVTDIPMIPYQATTPGSDESGISFRGSDNMNSAMSIMPNDKLTAILDIQFTVASGSQVNNLVNVNDTGDWQLMAFGSTNEISGGK